MQRSWSSRRRRGQQETRAPLRWIALVAAAGLIVWILLSFLGPDSTGPRLPPIPPTVRVVTGTVGVADARLRLYEDVDDGFAHEPGVSSGTAGAFTLEWSPRLSDRREHLYLIVEAEGFARTVVAAHADPVHARLEPGVAVAGHVLDFEGAEVPDVPLRIAMAHDPALAREVRTDRLGRFSVPGFPRGAPLEILILQPGALQYVEARFHAGDSITLRVHRAEPVTVQLYDPTGRPIAGARVALPGPPSLEDHLPAAYTDANGVAQLRDVSRGGPVRLQLKADGYLSAQISAVPNLISRETLWPARTLELQVWDAERGGGVANLEHEVELVEDLEAWHRSSSGGIQHRFPLRFSTTPGRYLLDLPAAPVELALEAPGYRYRRVRVRAKTTRTSAPLVPRGSAPTAMLRLRPRPGEEPAPIAMPMVIVDEDTGWHRVVDLVPGGVDVQVPPGRDLFLASVGAQDGFWTPKRAVRSPAAGELLEVVVGLRAARYIHVTARRPLNGELLLKDTKQGALELPLRAELRGGRAVLWGRPGRELLLEVRYEGNFFVERVQVTPGHGDVRLDLPVTAGAGVNVVVADSAGNPIPFAEVRLWPPAADGVYSLHHRPQVEFSDADGIAAFLRLQPGQAAVEVRADGFGRESEAQVRLKQGETTHTPLELGSALVWWGRIMDPDGKRLAGVWIQALGPAAQPLRMPNGQQWDMYNPEDGAPVQAVTDKTGEFAVLDETDGKALLVVDAPEGDEFGPAAVVPAGREIRLAPAAGLVLQGVRGRVTGVFWLLPGKRALLLYRDRGMTFRPVSLLLPAGRQSLYVRMRDGRTAVFEVDLVAGETLDVTPRLER
ncbi:MAG: hypothetical protein ACE10D_01780 [Planctomycetota bacterium]|nr:carboxypeptidase-like regulatory domain-containing protein [Planctomycetota bacterium]